MQECQRCNGKIIHDIEAGEEICSQCGIIIEEKITDIGAARMKVSNDGTNHERTGMQTTATIYDMGLSTTISKSNRDHFGKAVNSHTLSNLRKWDARSRSATYQARVLRKALTDMSALCDRLQITHSIAEHAALIYRRCAKRDLIRGRTVPGMIAACVYSACRDEGIPTTLEELAKSINIKKGDVMRCYKMILRELQLTISPPEPEACLSKIANAAKIPEKNKRKAAKIISDAKKKGHVSGKNPIGIAAGALYLACIGTDSERSQKDMALASGVTEVTIKNRSLGLREVLDIKCGRIGVGAKFDP